MEMERRDSERERRVGESGGEGRERDMNRETGRGI